VNLVNKTQLPVSSPQLKLVNDSRDKLGQLQGSKLNRSLSRLDPGEVQYFIDHFEKMFSASQDRSQFRSSIVAGFPAPEEYLGKAENAIDRRPKLMAHVCQECRFRPVGRFRIFPR
jgi:hypothetical protein